MLAVENWDLPLFWTESPIKTKQMENSMRLYETRVKHEGRMKEKYVKKGKCLCFLAHKHTYCPLHDRREACWS